MTGHERGDDGRPVEQTSHSASQARAGGALLSIGDFSRYSRLSVRMLRHYDERGVLAPADVDPFTGYRRYAPEQLRIAGRIRSLRDAGCGVPLIAELLPLFQESPDALQERLEAHVAGLEAAAEQLAAQRRLTRSLIASIDSTEPIVAERTFAAARVLTLHRRVACYPAEGELWSDLRDLLAAPAEVDPSLFGDLIGATYFDADYRDDDVEMAIWREYRGPFAPRRGFEIAELPARLVATTTHRGGFETIGRATQALGEWIAQHGRTQIGPLFNVYVVGPGRVSDPEQWVTEVNIPIA